MISDEFHGLKPGDVVFGELSGQRFTVLSAPVGDTVTTIDAHNSVVGFAKKTLLNPYMTVEKAGAR